MTTNSLDQTPLLRQSSYFHSKPSNSSISLMSIPSRSLGQYNPDQPLRRFGHLIDVVWLLRMVVSLTYVLSATIHVVMVPKIYSTLAADGANRCQLLRACLYSSPPRVSSILFPSLRRSSTYSTTRGPLSFANTVLAELPRISVSHAVARSRIEHNPVFKSCSHNFCSYPRKSINYGFHKISAQLMSNSMITPL
jgi:hypothetical protein